MALKHYAGGIGGSSGDTLATSTAPLICTNIIYVDSVTGSDAYGGDTRLRPKGTLAGAYAVASAGSIIVLLSTHTETISSVVTVSLANITIVGEGLSSGQPTASIAHGNNIAITVTGVNCQIRGIKFVDATASTSSSKVVVDAAGCTVRGCRFECGANTAGVGLEVSANGDYLTVRDTTFISTTTTAANRPSRGMVLSSAPTGVELCDVVFDDGTLGFTNSAFGFVTLDLTDIRAENISLLRGAEFIIGGAGSVYGSVQIGTRTGGGYVS